MPSKILFVSNSEKIGGGNRSLLSVVKGLKGRGWEATILVPSRGQFPELLEKENVPYRIVETHAPQGLAHEVNLVRRLGNLFRSEKPDIIHANSLQCYRPAAFAARVLGIPIVCHMRYIWGEEEFRHYLRAAPDRLIFNSDHSQAAMLPGIRRRWPHVAAEVIYNGFQPQDYWKPEKRTEVRAALGIGLETAALGVVGNFAPQKGHDVYLEAAALLKDRVQRPIRHLFAGQDLSGNPQADRLRRRADELELGESVSFVGFEEDVGRFMSGLDLLVVPSLQEPFGRVAVEGLLAGIPVVASMVGGLSEILEAAPMGRLVVPGDPEDLASGIQQALATPPSESLRRLAREWAAEKFSLESSLDGLENLYQRTLMERPSGWRARLQGTMELVLERARHPGDS